MQDEPIAQTWNVQYNFSIQKIDTKTFALLLISSISDIVFSALSQNLYRNLHSSNHTLEFKSYIISFDHTTLHITLVFAIFLLYLSINKYLPSWPIYLYTLYQYT